MVGGGLSGLIGPAHLISARMHGLYELVAGSLSSDPKIAHDSAGAYGIAPDRSYETYKEMAKAESGREDGIEVVAIVTPNDLHVGPALEFARRGVDVICEKPISDTLERALELQREVKKCDVVFMLTHNYSGYPLVRQARSMVRDGRVGALLQTRAEYLQDGVLARGGTDKDSWRGRPERCGPAGSLADIGSHAYHMLRFVTGVDAEAVAAITTVHTANRQLDDHCEILMRYANGALGSMTFSQAAIGKKCDLNFQLYGDKGSLSWGQEDPNDITFCELGKPRQTYRRGTPYLDEAATPASNIAAGHTEGYYEAFAQIYRDAHSLITARRESREPPSMAKEMMPTVDDGVAVARFINAVVQSDQSDSAWVELGSTGAA